MPEKKYSLLMQLGPRQGESIDLGEAEFIMGRDPDSDWPIDDVEVSRRHARLVLQDGGYAVEDLGSTNGTFVNGQRIRSVLPLLAGATIRLGENVLLYFDAASAKSAEGAEDETDTQTMDVVASENGASSSPVEEAVPEKAASRAQRIIAQDRGKSQRLQPRQIESHPEEPPMQTIQPAYEEEEPAALPFFRRPIVLGFFALSLLGICALTAFLWYVDANFLWCDVFGGLISACR